MSAAFCQLLMASLIHCINMLFYSIFEEISKNLCCVLIKLDELKVTQCLVDSPTACTSQVVSHNAVACIPCSATSTADTNT